MAMTTAVLCVSLALSAAQDPPFTPDVHRLIPDVDPGYAGYALGDVDRDGDVDLVHPRHVWLNDGSARFVEREASLPEFPPWSQFEFALVDLDADGDLDLVGGGGGRDFTCMNDGTGGFASDVRRLPPSPSIFSQYGCGFDATIAVGAGDLDLDGDVDLVLGDASSDCEYGCCTWGMVRLLENDGNGSFTDRTHSLPMSLVATDVSALELADFDGDQDLDLALMRSGESWAHDSVYLNDGDARFTELIGAIPAQSFYGGRDLEAFDLEGDGDVDLAFSHDFLTLLENDGTGRFALANHKLPALPQSFLSAVRSGDFDADGDADLLLVSHDFSSGAPSTGILFVNDGTGTFSDQSTKLPPGSANGAALAIADLDRDGDLDAIPAVEEHLRAWLNDGSARFTAFDGLIPAFCDFHTFAAVAGDIDGDGNVDLVLEGNRELVVLANDGSAGMHPKPPPVPSDTFETESLALGDVDGDADLDLVTAADFGPERLYTNDGTGKFVEVPGQLVAPADRTTRVLLLDLDGDGDLDLFSGARIDVAKVYFNDGSGKFTWQPSAWPGHIDYIVDAAAGDVDGDGDIDLLLQNVGARLYLNDGLGHFSEHDPFPGENVSWTVSLGDVDRDGDLDALLLDGHGTTQERLRLFLNDGSASFTDASEFLPALDPEQHGSVAFEDVEPDGDPDILIGGPQVLVNDGQGRFAPPQRLTAHPIGGLPLVAADLDRDGDTDFVTSSGYAEFRLLKNRATHLAWETPPRPGRVLAFELAGTPHGSAVLFGSVGLARAGFATPGLLRIDPRGVFFQQRVEFDAAGRGEARFDVPDDPALVGVTHYWQALELTPRRATNLELSTYGSY